MTTLSPQSQTPSTPLHAEQPLRMSYDEHLAWANKNVPAARPVASPNPDCRSSETARSDGRARSNP
jgi:hypothetical protein